MGALDLRMEEEPILTENEDRFCMFPIKYDKVWEMYKKAEASFWTGKANSSLQEPLRPPTQSLLRPARLFGGSEGPCAQLLRCALTECHALDSEQLCRKLLV